MIVVGIDPSATATGVVAIYDSPESYDTSVFKFPEYRGLHRAKTIATCVINFCIAHNPDVIVIEGYGHSTRNVGTIVILVEVGTLIRQAIRDVGKCYYTVPPTTLKKVTTGSGNANKHAMAEHVFERWGFLSSSEDIVDAYALARFGHELASNPTQLHKGVIYES